ncbi:Uncharacterised protein [Chlamydia abortus]|nr:Uncharacterised protein [Chlamydia abortus]
MSPARDIPCLISKGSNPTATPFNPDENNTSINTTAVVDPSPTCISVCSAASLASFKPVCSKASVKVTSLAIEAPCFVT